MSENSYFVDQICGSSHTYEGQGAILGENFECCSLQTAVQDKTMER